uniref:Hyaluronidase n=2 Tax=Takifugu rubripes TaxID=31033 RepID=H2UB23_TAKRU
MYVCGGSKLFYWLFLAEMTTSFHHELLLLFLQLTRLVMCLQLKASPFSEEPFVTIWNAPTASCLTQHGVDLDLSMFSIVHNQHQSFMGEDITIFYAEKLGLYPRYSGQKVAVNGGVPQNASLDRHLRAASEDIRSVIADKDFQGLAVVDWESWRPVWDRNWDSKRVYQEASKALVKARHPEWRPEQVEAAARAEFEEAARKFMEETLELGQNQRPNGLWGFYGFPSCYNNYSPQSAHYTGECPEVEKKRNSEQLGWLWNVSSALYPDIYLSLELRDLHGDVLQYSRHRILEAMRAGALAPSAPSVFPYTRMVYTYSLDFLSQEHLVYTIGESAALGSAGVVLWGDNDFSKSKATCAAIKSFIDETLGHYLVNVTTAAALCSQTLCSSRGRCQRRDPRSRTYLHLDPASWKVVSERGAKKSYRVVGRMRTQEPRLMRAQFECQCFTGWRGESCSQPIQE